MELAVPVLSLAEAGRVGSTWLAPCHGQQQGTARKRKYPGISFEKGDFWQRRGEGSSFCNLYYVRNKRLQLRQEPC